LAMARSGVDLRSCPICSAAVEQDAGFTFAAILTLAMTIGANSVFSKLMNGLGRPSNSLAGDRRLPSICQLLLAGARRCQVAQLLAPTNRMTHLLSAAIINNQASGACVRCFRIRIRSDIREEEAPTTRRLSVCK
jgi:hypothetical protein